MDIAIVSGANTRIGLAISCKLIETGCRVYGLANSFRDLAFEHSDFIPVTCDLTNTEHLCKIVQEIIETEKNIYVLVNHARYVNRGKHEKLGLNDLESLVHTNLLAPLLLTRLALPSLIRLQGYVLNIGFSDLSGGQRLGSAFLSTELALRQFSDGLYEEVRMDKVKVCSLILDIGNPESIFKEGVTPGDNRELTACSEAIAQAVEFVISQKPESVISSLVVRSKQPQLNAQSQAKKSRKVAAPSPYKKKQEAKKVVIGRLKKKAASETEKLPPATYMKMAQEVAEEEARGREETKNERDSQRKRRPLRKRGSRTGPPVPRQGGIDKSNKSSSGTLVKSENRKASRKRRSKKIKSPIRIESSEGSSESERKRALKKTGKETTPNKSVSPQKVRIQKKPSRKDRSANSFTKKDSYNVASKKPSKKRTAIETVKKTAGKRSSPKH